MQMKRIKVVMGVVVSLGVTVLAPSACGEGEGAEAIDADAQVPTSSSSGDSAPPTDTPDSGDLDRCATETLGGDLLPLELTLLFDVSSSLCFVADPLDAGSDAGADAGDADAGDQDAGDVDAGDADAGDVDAGDAGPSGPGPYDHGHFDCTNPASRWPATREALRAFLSSPKSAGLTLAVRTFGPVDSWTPPSVANNRCASANSETPDFEATELPSTSFANRVAGIAVDTRHPDATQTQTSSVIVGATKYTKARAAALAGSKGVAMVLVTDGNPQGCDPGLAVPNYGTEQDRQYAYAAAAGALAQGLKLYVLNIGGSQDVLDRIASQGGTEAAITLTDPTDTDAILQSLETIRRKALSCEVAIPVPASGVADFEKLNVVWTPEGSGGAPQPLVQSSDCADPRGWSFDNPSQPSKITLCPAVCAEVIASEIGKLDIVLGCQTRARPVD